MTPILLTIQALLLAAILIVLIQRMPVQRRPELVTEGWAESGGLEPGDVFTMASENLINPETREEPQPAPVVRILILKDGLPWHVTTPGSHDHQEALLGGCGLSCEEIQ